MTDDYRHLERLFMWGVEARNRRDLARAKQHFQELLRHEPRIPEPRLELASIFLEQGDWEEAEVQAREAVMHLDNGWQWLDDLTQEEMRAYGYNLLGEILDQASTQQVLSDIESAQKLWKEAESLFALAVELDPNNSDALRNHLGHRSQKRS